MKSILSSKSLSIGYHLEKEHKLVHQDISFSLNRSELTSLLGANGAGKSTLIKTMARFIEPLSGEVILDGRAINSYSRAELARKISVVLTDRVMDSNLSSRDIIALGRYPYTGFFGRLTQQDREIIEQSALATGTEEMLERRIGSLSDGERQKVLIAKSLAQQTPIIILDEPTAFLDIKSRIEVMQLLHSLAQEQDKAIMVSTHDMDAALRLSDTLWTLKKGDGIRCGQTEDMVLDGAMSALFDQQNITFDITKGSFSIEKENLLPVELSGDNLCCLWLASALERNGMQIAPSTLKIEVLESNSYQIIDQNRKTSVTSIKEVIDYINNHRH